MKTWKKVKPLQTATIKDHTAETCGFCGMNLIFAEADIAEGLAWLSCPVFLAEREFSKEEHSSFSVPLAETGYRAGDELKNQEPINEKTDAKNNKKHHDKPNITNPKNENRKKYTKKTR
ncbi:MAG: hypothetical protein PHQ31_01975 [Acidaminococcaceae bacterium]|jgi:hypothetical protein|nr:hypothetical protein [Acidaminococcaceae bacterium]